MLDAILQKIGITKKKSGQKHDHLPQLDGWRGISISLVLAAHLLPVGPPSWGGNPTAAYSGMVLFFNLSGFLIVTFLQKRPEFLPFLIRRFFRILPLAWLASAILLVIYQGSYQAWISHFLFLLNYQKEFEWAGNAHFWSLCVEMHFYVGAAILILVGGRRALWILPAVGLGITLNRILQGVPASGYTHLRVDEILAGATIALLVPYKQQFILRYLLRPGAFIWFVVLLICSNPNSGFLMYLRPYAGMLAVFSSLAHPQHRFCRMIASSRLLAYLAEISYALYILHLPLRTGWFVEGTKMYVYLVKRPITLTLTFLLASLSTYYWEAFWIRIGYRITANPQKKPQSVDKSSNVQKLFS